MDGKLLNFPYILGTGVLSLLIYEDFPPILLTTTFSNFVQPLPPTSLSSQTPTPIVFSVALFIWLNEWSGHIWCAILCNDKMDLHMSSLHTLVPKGPWCVFYATRCQVFWGLTHEICYSDLISHEQNRRSTLSGQ